AGTNKQISWICKNGHMWKTKVTKRLEGTGCPYCKGKLAIKGVNDLPTTNSELMKEWIYDKNPDPTTIKAG
ncbi:MAG: zinc-ribbon domain-containing protein, partial [Oscillospiraceae bacterium]|nr:zinc-ribbon domain-containing protein [Oscillospiraceae bacterium]